MPPEEIVEEEEVPLEEDPALLDDGGADEPFLTPADVQMIVQGITEALTATLLPQLDLEKKMAGYLNEMKTMLTPAQAQAQQKDDERSKEITTLKERLSILEGEQPVAAKNARTPEGLGIEVPAEIGQLFKQHNGDTPADPLSAFLSSFNMNGARTPGGN